MGVREKRTAHLLEGAAATYAKMAAEQDAPDVQGAKQSTDTIDGVPVLLTYTNDSGPGNVYFSIGTANDNAVEVEVTGRYQPSDLEPVAQSMIDQWAAANEPASGAMGVHPSGSSGSSGSDLS